MKFAKTNMKTSLVGTIFLFVSIFGQNSPANHDSISLVQNITPCTTTKECQQKLGLASQCKDHSCVCPLGGQWKECPMNEVIVTQARNNPGSYIGDRCDSDESCKIPNTSCNEQTKQCECVKGHIPSRDKSFCLNGAAQQLGDSCYEDAQCHTNFPNSTCSGQKKCECRENYHEAEHNCWKNVGFGETCGDTRECMHIGAQCNAMRSCVCGEKTILNEKRSRCLNIAGHKGECLENIQCTQNLNNSQCIDGFCTCNENYHYSIKHKNCIKSKVFGEPCEEDDECNQITGADNENTVFCGRNKTCDCKKGYERAISGKMCFKFIDPSSASGIYPTTLVLVTIVLFLL